MDENEYSLIKREILRLTDVDLSGYKSPQMQRRLKTYLLRAGQPSWTEFFKHIRNDPNEIAKLKDYLTINVTSFFRDIEKFNYLEKTIFPELLKTNSTLRIWSAGCSRGHEPYSLAMMLTKLTGPYRTHKIMATDLDRSALAWAKAGGPYTKDEIKNVTQSDLTKYFTLKPDGYYINEQIRKKITFAQTNLLTDNFLPITERKGNFDLVICRNVVIYFTAEVKDMLYRRFYEMLRPGGILFVGGTEIVSKSTEIGFQSAGISFYRRNGIDAPPSRFGRNVSPRPGSRGK
jgi:chemotaxis protein methyltransferase CheR